MFSRRVAKTTPTSANSSDPVPCYNVSPTQVRDRARLIRPATLRGLAPDHTLVPVNRKRRHSDAVIT